MKTSPNLLVATLLAACPVFDLKAQSYGTIYPKYQSISTTGASSGFSGTLWDDAVGESWNYPARNYAYGTIRAGTGDNQAMVSVTNGNFAAALTPPDQLGNFLNGKSYSTYKTHDVGFGKSGRSYGCYVHFLTFPDKTTVGYGIRTSKWSGYQTSDATLGYKAFLYSNWGYQPGNNPKFNGGNYSSFAWTRAGWLGTYSLYQPSLRMGSGKTRRWTIGEFTTAIDSRGACPYRYIFTTAENLTASVNSNIFIIPKSDQQKFLSNNAFTSYAKLFNTGASQEVSLPAGRTYCIAVRDGVNVTSSEGAQVIVYGQYYR